MINNYAVLDEGNWVKTIFTADDQDINLINEIVKFHNGTSYVNETLYPYPNGFAANWNDETKQWDIDYTVGEIIDEPEIPTPEDIARMAEENK